MQRDFSFGFLGCAVINLSLFVGDLFYSLAKLSVPLILTLLCLVASFKSIMQVSSRPL